MVKGILEEQMLVWVHQSQAEQQTCLIHWMDKALLPTDFCADGLGAVPGMCRCSKPSPGPHSLQAALRLTNPQCNGEMHCFLLLTR